METKEPNTELQDSSKEHNVHPIIQIMTHTMNYLSLSLYQDQFTKNHQDSYSIIQSIYDNAVLTPSMVPSLNDCENFYSNLVYLANVTFTDDPDYYTLKLKMRKYIIGLKYIQ
jgi:hypothetical protein